MKSKLTINSVRSLPINDKAYDVHDTELAGFVLRVRPSGLKTYLLFYRNKDGKKRTHTIGSSLTATQARDIAQRLYGDIKNGVDINQRDKDQKNEAERLDNTKFDTFLEQVYKTWLVENRKSGAHAYRRLKRSFDCLSSKQLDAITPLDMERWKRVRKQSNISDSTLKNDVAELKAMLNRARQWGYIKQHLLIDYSSPRANKTKIARYLSDSESQRLYSALQARETERKRERLSGNEWRSERGYDVMPMHQGFSDHLMPMVILTLNTGIRRGEVFSLEWRDVDLNTKTLRVRAEIAKGNKERYIPLNDEALTTLMMWRDCQESIDGLIFPSVNGEPFDNIYKAWSALLERADIEDFRFHDLRHNFASQLVMKGVDLYTVKELLGHSTITVTERYAHLAPKKLADAVALL